MGANWRIGGLIEPNRAAGCLTDVVPDRWADWWA
jgi:hypothetical protein